MTLSSEFMPLMSATQCFYSCVTGAVKISWTVWRLPISILLGRYQD